MSSTDIYKSKATKDIILEVFEQLRKRKSRPDFFRISSIVERKYNIATDQTQLCLNELVNKNIITRVEFKGNHSYRYVNKNKINENKDKITLSQLIIKAVKKLTLPNDKGVITKKFGASVKEIRKWIHKDCKGSAISNQKNEMWMKLIDQAINQKIISRLRNGKYVIKESLTIERKPSPKSTEITKEIAEPVNRSDTDEDSKPISTLTSGTTSVSCDVDNVATPSQSVAGSSNDQSESENVKEDTPEENQTSIPIVTITNASCPSNNTRPTNRRKLNLKRKLDDDTTPENYGGSVEGESGEVEEAAQEEEPEQDAELVEEGGEGEGGGGGSEGVITDDCSKSSVDSTFDARSARLRQRFDRTSSAPSPQNLALSLLAPSPQLPATLQSPLIALPRCDFCLLTSEKGDVIEPLLFCCDCQAKAHPSCMHYSEVLARRARLSRWQCIDCKVCCICHDSQDTVDEMLFCDSCDKGYHMHCHFPIIDSKPKGNWECSECYEKLSNTALKIESSEEKYRKFPYLKKDVIPDVTDWSVEQVMEYFSGKGFKDHVNVFKRQEIDGTSLLLLRRSDVIESLTLNLGPALKIYHHIECLQKFAICKSLQKRIIAY